MIDKAIYDILAGRPGPGEIMICEGFIASISAKLILSLNATLISGLKVPTI
jgi:hypothetical protein